MERKFWFNKHINLAALRDSMQLDSGQTIASMETENYLVTLEVRGDVRVLYNPDPDGDAADGQIYKHASAFPDELLDIFASGKDYSEMKNVSVVYNNWFELFIFERKEKSGSGAQWEWTGWSDVTDDGPFNEESLKTDLEEYLKDYLENEN